MEITELPINEAELTTIRVAVEDSPELPERDEAHAHEIAVERMETLQLHAIRLLEVIDAFMLREGGNLAHDVREVLRARILEERDGRQALRGNVTIGSLSVVESRDPLSGHVHPIVDIRLKVSPT